MKRVFFIISLILNISVNLLIITNRYSQWVVLLWLLSILLLFFSTLNRNIFFRYQFKISVNRLLLFFLILLPVLVRLFLINPTRIHTDEFITGYFSAHYAFSTYNFFSAIPQNKVDWQNQFPTPYFVLQKIFFLIFGVSPISLKLSTLPYVFIVNLMTFLLAKRMFNRRTAIIAVFLSSFFAVSLYLETYSLHFISSTAIFLLFFYFAYHDYQENKLFYASITGFFCAACYLFYFSSYIAFPFALLFYLTKFLKTRNRQVIKSFVFFLIGFTLTISPFLSYAFKFNNYMPVRFQQVSYANQVKDSKKPVLSIIKENFDNSFQSFYKDGIGGCGGYDFGHLSFFDHYSLILFLLSFLTFGYLFIKKQNIWFGFILLVLLVSFLGAMVLTTPPPPYHRFSIAYPFIIIIFSSFFYFFFSLSFLKYFRFPLIFILIAFFIYQNFSQFNKAVNIDKNNQEEETGRIKIMNYLENNYPNRKIYFASFPSYAFEKVYYIFDPKREYVTDYHDNLLKKFNRQEKYVYIMIFPDAFKDQFIKADPNGKFINTISKNYGIFVN